VLLLTVASLLWWIVLPVRNAQAAVHRMRVLMFMPRAPSTEEMKGRYDQEVSGLGGKERAGKALHMYFTICRPDGQEKIAALELMWFCGKHGVPGLQRALSDPDREALLTAIWGLDRLGPDAAAAAGDLAGLLHHEDNFVRHQVIIALGKIGPAAAKAVPELTLGLKDPAIRKPCISALGDIGPAARSAVPSLVRMLEEKDAPGCFDIECALGQIGDRSPKVLKALTAKLQSKSSLARSGAGMALVKLDGPKPEYLAPLIEGISAKMVLERANNADFLGDLGRDARAAIPALEKLLKDESTGVRKSAQRALRLIRGDQ